jgi:hypothetical protein
MNVNDRWQHTWGRLVRKLEGKRPLGKHTCKCEDNIKMDVKKIRM